MLAALEHTHLPWVAIVPCDAPQLPLDLVARLAQASMGRRPAVARCAGRLQPVFCLLPRTLAGPLRAAMADGERRPLDFLRRAGSVAVDFDDATAFTNINRD